MNKSRSVTLTTGPFHVPDINQNGSENNRLVITLTNPTNRPLSATVRVESYSTGEPPFIFLPDNYALGFVLLHDFGLVVVAPNSSQRLELLLPPFERTTLRIVSRGDYEVEDGRAVRGKLEISSIAGFGNTLIGPITSDLPGLESSDASTFFRFTDYTAHDD